MKKTYINPNTKIVKIQTARMMAGSELGKYSSDGNGNTISSNDAVLSRRRNSVWDEDEEEY